MGGDNLNSDKGLRGFLEPIHARFASRKNPIERRFRQVEYVVGWDPSKLHHYDDLMPFVTMSDKAPDINGAHPELYGEKRHQLYNKWHKWCPEAFLFLEVKSPEGEWEAVAVSIILPLTNEAQCRLLQGEENAVLNLKCSDIDYPDTAKHLLIDTWILDSKKSLAAAGYAHGLVAKHLSMFGNLAGRNVIIEPDAEDMQPDVQNMHKVAVDAGFSGPVNGFYTKSIDKDRSANNAITRQLLSNIQAWSMEPLFGEQTQGKRYFGI